MLLTAYCACSEYSKQLNDSRIMILQAREDALQGIITDVDSKLASFSSNKKKYTSLLTDLIIQVCASSISASSTKQMDIEMLQ